MKKNSLSYRSKRRKINEEMLAYSSPNVLNSALTISPPANISLQSENVATINKPFKDNCVINSNVIEIETTANNNTHNNSTFKDFNEQSVFEELFVAERNNSSSDFENFQSENCTLDTFRSLLAQWAVTNKIPQCALNGLLLILRKHKCFTSLPKDSRTILETKPIDMTKMCNVESGKYYHFGIQNGIINNFVSDHFPLLNEIKLVIGIDGTPISQSTSNQFWPILGYIRPKSNKVFQIGLYHGTEKPMDSNVFLKHFVTEAKHLVSNGILINNKLYKLIIDVFCCDMPAKAFILKIKNHNGYSSCSRCEIDGFYKDNHMCFPYSNQEPKKRSHNNYINQSDSEQHTSSSNSCLLEIPGLDVTTDFSHDYMHLVTLGIMKKLLILWMSKGPLNVRLPASKINLLSNSILSLRSNFASEFSRKPRKLEDVCRWKATEFRSFLLYVGPVIFKNVISDDCYKNFMAINIAMIILLSPDHMSLIEYAEKLLHYFVQTFEQLYGQKFVSANIHGVLHLVDDYQRYGPLDNCSSFPFENYMRVLKSMLRKPHKPLEQAIKRYNESESTVNTNSSDMDDSFLSKPHSKGPLLSNNVSSQFSTLTIKGFKLKCEVEADSYFISKNNDIIKLINIAHAHDNAGVVLIGKQFILKENLYNEPIQSSHFGIYIVNNLSDDLNSWSINDVKKKVMLFKYKNISIAVPLLHSS